MTDWGVHKYGATLHINEQHEIDPSLPIVIDLETDEKDNFVGFGYTQSGTDVYYRTVISPSDMEIFGKLCLIGHNLKFDAKLLVKWGIPVKPEQLFADTILMSYAMNATKESHGLKDLGKELGYEWPSYHDLVGKGHKKQTLDKQPVELVANYCAMDVFVTFQLYQHLKRKMDLNASRIYNQIELSLMRILFEMELQGVLVDVEKLNDVHKQFSNRLRVLQTRLSKLSGREINPNSNKQVGEYLTEIGLDLPKTGKGNLKVDKFVLEQHQDLEFVKTLMEYNKLEKLVSTYTGGMLKRETLPKVFTTYNQITTENRTERGISTGRLSSSGPNLQQIPTRTDEGKALREMFIPSPGSVLIDADYSAVEPRITAHLSKDPFLISLFLEGRDPYEGLAEGTGRSRNDAKTFFLAKLYGAMIAKLARVWKCSEQEAEQICELFDSKVPTLNAWIKRVKFEAAKRKGIHTLMKRFIPIPGIDSRNKYERWHWERAAVNYLVQGSAAEIMKMAMIELRKQGWLPLLTVHDELLFEVGQSDFGEYDLVTNAIKTCMESVVKLDVPLVADVGIGGNWREAKGD